MTQTLGQPRDVFLRYAPHRPAGPMLGQRERRYVIDVGRVAGYIGDHIHTVTRVYAHWLRDKQHVPAGVLNRLYAQTPRNVSRLPHAA